MLFDTALTNPKAERGPLAEVAAVPQIVVAPNVRELVSQNVSKLAGVQERSQLGWQ
jgi:hypothetical protein